jgi:hypothetical protein
VAELRGLTVREVLGIGPNGSNGEEAAGGDAEVAGGGSQVAEGEAPADTATSPEVSA